MTVIERLGKLQEAFFEKTGALYQNIELLGDVLYNKMLNDAIEIYERESELLIKEAKTDYKIAEYTIERQAALKKPGPRFLFFGLNKPGKLIDREVTAEYKEQYNKRISAVEKREAALENAEAARSTEQLTLIAIQAILARHVPLIGFNHTEQSDQDETDKLPTTALSDQLDQDKSTTEQATTPATPDLSAQDNSKAGKAENPNARRNRKKRQQANIASDTAPIPLEEVSTDIGTQIRLQIP